MTWRLVEHATWGVLWILGVILLTILAVIRPVERLARRLADRRAELESRRQVHLAFGASAFMVAALISFSTSVHAMDLTGSCMLTIERSDAGELYAAATIVLDLAVAQAVGVVLLHEQAATGFRAFTDRAVTWDVSAVWRPGADWSASLGRRWRVGPPRDYGGPWTYALIWRGL